MTIVWKWEKIESNQNNYKNSKSDMIEFTCLEVLMMEMIYNRIGTRSKSSYYEISKLVN